MNFHRYDYHVSPRGNLRRRRRASFAFSDVLSAILRPKASELSLTKSPTLHYC